MEAQAVLTRTAKIWLDADGIVRITSLPGAHETLEDAQRTVATVVTLAAKTPRPVLVDLRAIGSQSRDARQYFGVQGAAAGVLGTAILAGSPVSRLVGNFFLGFGKPDRPAKLFTSEEDALAWLKEFLN